MKKTILIVGLVVLALGVLGLGVVLAQDVQPPVGRGGMTLAPGASAGVGGGYGSLHDYVEQALADKLGITEEEVEDALASGKTMYQIALDNRIKETDVASLLTEVHTAAFDKAVADGVITREQADFMLERMAGGFGYGRGMMNGGGFGRNGGGQYGPMHDYVEEALADKLGITEKDVEDALASGKIMYQIALDNGIKEADVASLLTEVHTAAFDKAVADGVITREQADFMLQRMAGGFGYGRGMMDGGFGRNGGGQYGPMHDYVEEALADKLGITEKDVEDALASGKTMYQIALDNGVKEADVASLLTEVHTAAFDKAVADGVITREQADFMLQRMTADGFNFGNCPMGQRGQFGQGNGYGRGMMGGSGQYGSGNMMGGGRWGQQAPTAQP